MVQVRFHQSYFSSPTHETQAVELVEPGSHRVDSSVHRRGDTPLRTILVKFVKIARLPQYDQTVRAIVADMKRCIDERVALLCVVGKWAKFEDVFAPKVDEGVNLPGCFHAVAHQG